MYLRNDYRIVPSNANRIGYLTLTLCLKREIYHDISHPPPTSARTHAYVLWKITVASNIFILTFKQWIMSWHPLTIYVNILIMRHRLNRNMLVETWKLSFLRKLHSARKSLEMPRALLQDREFLWGPLPFYTKSMCSSLSRLKKEKEKKGMPSL